MNILFLHPDGSGPWSKPLRQHIPEADVFFWGEDEIDKAAIDYACVWRPEPGLLATFPNLKAIYNLGAGVDVLLQDDTLPRHIPLVRLVDPRLTSGMVEYVVHWVLHFHRDMHRYAQQQHDKVWHQYDNADPAQRRIGFLGLGELAQGCAHALLMLGFESISAWSRTEKHLPGLTSFAGNDQFVPFLQQCDILVDLLPLTDATRHLLNADVLAHLAKGAFLINAGRGATVKDEDLIDALNRGHIAAAALDVFEDEPLNPDHPYWAMDSVHITPHIASLTTPDSTARILADVLRTLERGETPEHVVDWDQGY